MRVESQVFRWNWSQARPHNFDQAVPAEFISICITGFGNTVAVKYDKVSRLRVDDQPVVGDVGEQTKRPTGQSPRTLARFVSSQFHSWREARYQRGGG